MSRPKERARAPSHTPAILQPPSFPGQQNEKIRKSNHAEYRGIQLRSKHIHYLKSNSHDPMRVVQDAVASFHRTLWRDEQIRALKEWHVWYEAWYDCDASEVPDAAQMVYAITLLGRMFFLSSLDENTVQFSWNKSISQKYLILGSTSKLSHLQVRISMDPTDYHRKKRVRDHRSALTGTLLHECCHAFLRLYACRGYCGDIDCRVAKHSSISDGGHAGAWLYLPSHVEIAARNHLKWADVRLNIFWSLILESNASTYAPTRKDWEDLLGSLSDDGDRWHLLWSVTEADWAGLEKMYRRDEALVVNSEARVEETAHREVGEHKQALPPLRCQRSR